MDYSLIRSSYLGKKFKNLIEEKDLTISEVAKKIGSSQPTLSNTLKGKGGSDEYFERVGKAIGLTDKQIKEIFKEADLETLKYKYGEDVLSKKEYSYEELFEMMMEKENLNEAQIKAIKDFIEFQKRQGG